MEYKFNILIEVDSEMFPNSKEVKEFIKEELIKFAFVNKIRIKEEK